jgi:hypothetical protein
MGIRENICPTSRASYAEPVPVALLHEKRRQNLFERLLLQESDTSLIETLFGGITSGVAGRKAFFFLPTISSCPVRRHTIHVSPSRLSDSRPPRPHNS